MRGSWSLAPAVALGIALGACSGEGGGSIAVTTSSSSSVTVANASLDVANHSVSASAIKVAKRPMGPGIKRSKVRIFADRNGDCVFTPQDDISILIREHTSSDPDGDDEYSHAGGSYAYNAAHDGPLKLSYELEFTDASKDTGTSEVTY